MKNAFIFTGYLIAAMVLITAPESMFGQEKKEKAKAQEVDVEALMAEAQESIQGQEFAAAAKTLKKVVEADPKNALGWQLLGYSLHAGGKLDEAIEAHNKAATFDETKGIATYNLGCAYSLKNDLDKSIQYLHDAISSGFDDSSYFEDDADLENVRKDKRFEKIKARVKNDGVDPDFDAAKLIGDWEYTSGTRAGEKVPDERLTGGNASFSKEKITIPAGPSDQFVMKYKIFKRKYPVQIDIEIESGPAPEGKALGILKMDDDKLSLCYDPTGQKRPTSFESTSDNGFFLFEMKKSADKKPDEKKSDDKAAAEKKSSDK